MYVFTSKNERNLGQLFFRELQGLSFANEPLAVRTNDKSVDDSTKSFSTKSVELSKSKYEPTKLNQNPKHLEYTKNNKPIEKQIKIKIINKTRRGYGNKKKKLNETKNLNLTLVGTNSAGLS